MQVCTNREKDFEVVQLIDVLDEPLTSPPDQVVLGDEALVPTVVQSDQQVRILADSTGEVVDRQVQADFGGASGQPVARLLLRMLAREGGDDADAAGVGVTIGRKVHLGDGLVCAHVSTIQVDGRRLHRVQDVALIVADDDVESQQPVRVQSCGRRARKRVRRSG